jgi:hypothetical protein
VCHHRVELIARRLNSEVNIEVQLGPPCSSACLKGGVIGGAIDKGLPNTIAGVILCLCACGAASCSHSALVATVHGCACLLGVILRFARRLGFCVCSSHAVPLDVLLDTRS